MPKGRTPDPSWLGRRCPHCKSHAVRVVDTRQARNWRRRTKRCLNCGETGLTLEIEVVPGIRPLIEAVKQQGAYQVTVDEFITRADA